MTETNSPEPCPFCQDPMYKIKGTTKVTHKHLVNRGCLLYGYNAELLVWNHRHIPTPIPAPDKMVWTKEKRDSIYSAIYRGYLKGWKAGRLNRDPMAASIAYELISELEWANPLPEPTDGSGKGGNNG